MRFGDKRDKPRGENFHIWKFLFWVNFKKFLKKILSNFYKVFNPWKRSANGYSIKICNLAIDEPKLFFYDRGFRIQNSGHSL